MTNPDYRALCAELVDALDNLLALVNGECPSLLDGDRGGSGFLDIEIDDALTTARTLLAEPEAEGPTDEELYELWVQNGFEIDRFARAALDRWGRPDYRALLDQPMALSDIGQEWRPCVKLPITVHVRDQRPGETHSSTREGITPLRSDDLIMRGVQGEEYPIGRDLFEQTYELLPTPDAAELEALPE